MSVKTYGKFKRLIYQNQCSGFAIFELSVTNVSELKKQHSELNKSLICVGNIPEYAIGTPLEVEGNVEKSDYGHQLVLTKIKECSIDETMTAEYLSNICFGIGEVTSHKIATQFPNIFELAKNADAPSLLSSQIDGLDYDTAVMLCEAITKTVLQREVYELIFKYGGTWLNAIRLVEKYGIHSLNELTASPYEVGMTIGMDFYVCDKLAKVFNKTATDTNRLECCLRMAFNVEANKGNCFSTESDICHIAKRIIKKNAFTDDIPSAMFVKLLENNDNYKFEFNDEGCEAVYPLYMYRDEKNVALQIKRLMETSTELNFDESIVDWAEKTSGIKYAPQQRDSFSLIKQTGIAVITGGPGTGKSTILNGLINAYEKLNKNKIIRLCSPTGRASQRMTETTGREAVTIHRLLEYKPYGNDVTHKGPDNPIEADLIIVDESSMLDVNLASIFLSAVKSGSLVIFVGDINQLASVGAGDVLNDIINSQVVPTIQLQTVYRQGSESSIIQNANRINEGVPVFKEDDDYKTWLVNKASEICEYTIGLVLRLHNPKNPFESQVLCPSHKGEVGVSALNNLLQEYLNPASPSKKEIKYGSKKYREGDKIILLNNNYSAGYYNGDIGLIARINENIITINIQGQLINIGRNEMEDLSLAYAMSIHKSQGSQFDNVIVVLPPKPVNMLKRNLFYTAVTRAKKTVNVIGTRKSVGDAVERCETGTRNTWLSDRIKKQLNKEN